MRPRISQELALLRQVFDDVDHAEDAGEDWFHLPRYPFPPGWTLERKAVTEAPVAFLVKADYPSSAPYGFVAPLGLRFNSSVPNNTGDPPRPVPFPGEWLHFSWSVKDWRSAIDLNSGSNLLAWCRSFAVRLKEGA